ncbi:MAG: hypothetical protein GC187_00550 [Alphaproteobacteria bacterium]|nr:hypothetical protein [Alphaproteobacteria bacterium]
MASLTELVTKRVHGISQDYFSLMSNRPLSEEEKEALREAERLADHFAEVTPDRYCISGNSLFHPSLAMNENYNAYD